MTEECGRLRELVFKLGDRVLICAEILGRLAEKRKARGMDPRDVCKQCGYLREGHAHAPDGNVYYCPNGVSCARLDFFFPYTAPKVVEGVGPDAPIVENEAGGRQSDSPYRCDLLPARAALAVAKVLKEGAEKYGPDNWRKIPPLDHINHALSHLFALLAGDRSDDHLEHASCRLLMALDVELVGDANAQGA